MVTHVKKEMNMWVIESIDKLAQSLHPSWAEGFVGALLVNGDVALVVPAINGHGDKDGVFVGAEGVSSTVARTKKVSERKK